MHLRPATSRTSHAPMSTCWSSAPASPASTSCTAPAKRVLRAAARGRRRRGRHLVLEPLPRRAVRLRELHLRLPVLEGAVRRVGVAGALRASNRRPSATSTTWSTGSTCGATSGSTPRSRRPCTTSRRERGPWSLGDGTEFRTRFLVAATGVLSVPYFPDVPGRDDFRGESYHTGLWPATPVDFAGKRVAVIGTGSSGVQLIPAIADEVASLTVYQRTANWCTPLNNAPITPDEQAQLRADFEAIRETLNTSVERVPPPRARSRHLRRLERGAAGVLREDVEQPRLLEAHRATTPTCCSIHAANAEWCEFIAEKIRSIVDDPETAEKLIPKDHRFAREAAAVRDRLLRDVQQPERLARRSQADADRAHDRDAGSRRPTVCGSSTSSCGRPASTSAPARSRAWGSAAANGLALDGLLGRRSEDVPRRADHRLPELLLPRRAARGGRQQPAVQRRPGRLRHRHARVRARPRLRHDRSRPRRRRGVDQHGRHRRGDVARSARAATSSAPTSPASRASTS